MAQEVEPEPASRSLLPAGHAHDRILHCKARVITCHGVDLQMCRSRRKLPASISDVSKRCMAARTPCCCQDVFGGGGASSPLPGT